MFDALEEAGIVCAEPERAAERVLKIYDDVGAWWGSARTRAARGAFARRFALTDPDWPGRWEAEIRSGVKD